MSSYSAQFLETLLFKQEGDELDFKRDQYSFIGASDEAKSELVKDVLAFANAWKTSDAHILVGVDEVQCGRAMVVGIKAHIDDAALQQLVNSKTNIPIQCSYSAVEIDGKRVGVLKVSASQERPVFLTKNFGKLNAGVVYIRRGSSTDVAKPDEVAKMGIAQAVKILPAPCVEMGFGIPQEKKILGTRISVYPTVIVDPPKLTASEIQELAKALRDSKILEMARTNKLASHVQGLRPFPEPTRQERRDYAERTGVLVPVGFYAKNVSEVTAQDVRVEVRGALLNGLQVVDEIEHPEHDWRESGILSALRPRPVFPSREINLHKNANEWSLELTFGKIQPKATVWLNDVIYIGSRQPMSLELSAQVFADNMPNPTKFALAVEISPKEEVFVDPD